MLYLYNARYPDDYAEPHVIFQKYDFLYEYDSSHKREGLPGLCNLPPTSWFPIIPCAIDNYIVDIRDCSYIGYGKAFDWPRVHSGLTTPVSASRLQTMLGTAFVSCKPSNVQKSTVIPNVDVCDGCDSVSATYCLKLNFTGQVEPIWLGNGSRENVDVYAERLPGRRKGNK